MCSWSSTRIPAQIIQMAQDSPLALPWIRRHSISIAFWPLTRAFYPITVCNGRRSSWPTSQVSCLSRNRPVSIPTLSKRRELCSRRVLPSLPYKQRLPNSNPKTPRWRWLSKLQNARWRRSVGTRLSHNTIPHRQECPLSLRGCLHQRRKNPARRRAITALPAPQTTVHVMSSVIQTVSTRTYRPVFSTSSSAHLLQR